MGVIERVKAQERQTGWELGLQEGWQKGLARVEEEKNTYALKLKKTGVSVKIIAKSLGLSVEQVERL